MGDKIPSIQFEDYKVKNAEDSAYYIASFLSAAEEAATLARVYSAPRPKWTQLAHRRLQNWGGVPTAKGMVAEQLPAWLSALASRVGELGAFGTHLPNHVLVNEYSSGQGILAHLDGPVFHPVIATVSLGSTTVLRFKDNASLLLEPRSLLLLRDRLYTSHMHYIEEVTEDRIDDSIANLDLCEGKYKVGSTLPRGTRVSLTIRHVPKTTTFKINIGNKSGGGKAGQIVGAYQVPDGSFELTPTARAIDESSGGAICKALSEWGCGLSTSQPLVTEAGGTVVGIAALGGRGAGYNALELLDESREAARCGVGAAARALAERGCTDIKVDGCGAPDAAAEAAVLATWRFQEFKACANRSPEPKLGLLPEDGAAECPEGGEGGSSGGGGAPGGAGGLWKRGATLATAQNWARWLSDMPANRMTPVDFAQEALNVLCPLGVRVEAHDRSWVSAQNMQAFLAVSRGSCETPIFLEAFYDGAGENAPCILLAAKGITFDSGGLCLKPAAQMRDNRGSMAGAAVACAALRALAELKVPVTVRMVIPLCENMVSGQCMKVGDVLPALNGLSIKVENTDMEGRVALADALVYGQAVHRPALVVDVATLTRGILLATGGGAFGCFSNSESAWAAVKAAAARSGDRAWRFPLWQYYANQLTNDASVDLRNKGSGRATPCLGAAFLKNFVCGDWVHMDITGVGKLGHAPAPPYLDARRMTGRPTRTLALFLEAVAAGAKDPAAKPACLEPKAPGVGA